MNQSNAQFRRAAQNGLGHLLAYTLQNDTRVSYAFKAEVVQAVRTSRLSNDLGKLFVSDRAIHVPIAISVVELADKQGSRTSMPESSAVPPPAPLTGSNSTSFESMKDRSKKTPKTSM